MNDLPRQSKRRWCDLFSYLDSCQGVTYDASLSGGGHIKITVRNGERKQLMVAAATPSDFRAQANALSLAKRTVRKLTGAP